MFCWLICISHWRMNLFLLATISVIIRWIVFRLRPNTSKSHGRISILFNKKLQIIFSLFPLNLIINAGPISRILVLEWILYIFILLYIFFRLHREFFTCPQIRSTFFLWIIFITLQGHTNRLMFYSPDKFINSLLIIIEKFRSSFFTIFFYIFFHRNILLVWKLLTVSSLPIYKKVIHCFIIILWLIIILIVIFSM